MASTVTRAIARTSRNVTLPIIQELFDPNFLNVLIPERKTDTTPKQKDIVPSNPLVTALLNDNRTYTEKGAPALSSTGSAILDAFNGLSVYSFGEEVNNYLADAWAEDPGLTLRLIWNTRSIHDGKGEKELFYRYAPSMY